MTDERPWWGETGDGCDVCGEWTRRRCGCGAPVCVDCAEQPHREGQGGDE